MLVMVIQGSLAIAFALTAVSPQLSRQMNTEPAYLQSFGQEKNQRTLEQQKIDSQLLYAIYQMRGEAESKGVPTEPIQLEKDVKGRVLVDIRAPVTKKVLAQVKKFGGTVVSSSDRYHSIIAYLPLGKLEALAHSREVKFIAPKAQSMTN